MSPEISKDSQAIEEKPREVAVGKEKACGL